MAFKGIEKRTCIRFDIPGATVSFRNERRLFSSASYEEYCPLLDISRGGLRFLSQKSLKINSKLTLKISIPDDKNPFDIRGRVGWSRTNPGMSYKYQVGFQFFPYGDKKKHNPPNALVNIIALEEKFGKDQ